MSARPPAGDYLRTQLIPYLGNKRTLLPALGSVFRELAQDRKDIRFLDPFAGSGSVSRLARTLGFRVEANDWEHYSYVLNDCWLALGAEDLDRAFGSAEGLRRELEELNALHPHAPGFRETTQGEPYMARWYAPRSTAEPVLGRERLFYTAENARFIDSVRATIEERYPERDPRSPGGIRRRIFLAALVLEAAVHANTSGVFKAYHRGFGGHGGDALKRILARMELEAPCLPDLPACGVSRMDASAFASRRPADIVYLDPPYNQHQYGSNYHILNTIVRWDRKPVPLDIGSDGELERKAGIPDEWKRTSSPFCRKREAAEAMRSLLDSIDASVVVLSWNGEGHIAVEELAEILSERGRLEAKTLEYVTYRGGRQSDGRRNANREFLFVLNTGKKAGGGAQAVLDMRRSSLRDEALRSNYDPRRLGGLFELRDGFVLARTAAIEARLPFVDYRRMKPEAATILDAMEPDCRDELLRKLLECACSSAQENLDALYVLLATGDGAGKRARAEVTRYLRKLAHRRYAADFCRYLERYAAFAEASSDRAFLSALDGLKILARKRFAYDTDTYNGI